LIYAGTVATSLAILSTALLRRGKEGDPDRVFDFCTMALSVTMASPIAWEHHYGIIFPIFAGCSRRDPATACGSYCWQ
jgi:hypothetical protein